MVRAVGAGARAAAEAEVAPKTTITVATEAVATEAVTTEAAVTEAVVTEAVATVTMVATVAIMAVAATVAVAAVARCVAGLLLRRREVRGRPGGSRVAPQAARCRWMGMWRCS